MKKIYKYFNFHFNYWRFKHHYKLNAEGVDRYLPIRSKLYFELVIDNSKSRDDLIGIIWLILLSIYDKGHYLIPWLFSILILKLIFPLLAFGTVLSYSCLLVIVIIVTFTVSLDESIGSYLSSRFDDAEREIIFKSNPNLRQKLDPLGRYEYGQKESEGTLKDGKQDGLWTWWYKNGKKEGEQTYKDDELISSKDWNEDGSVKE